MMISPGYAYEKAPDQEHFLGVDQTQEMFTAAFADGHRKQVAAQPHARCSSTSSRARSTSTAPPWAIPSYSVFGWQRPCYLMADGYAGTLPGADRDDGLGQLRPRQATRGATTAWPTAATSRRRCVATTQSLRQSLRAMVSAR